MKALAFLFASAALISTPRLVQAAEIAYEAPPGCPSREAAVALLGSKASGARAVKITIHPRRPSGFAAEAVLGSAEEDPVTRHLEGETCRGVIDALGVVLALDKPDKPDKKENVATADEPMKADPAAVPLPVTPVLAGGPPPTDAPTSEGPDARSAVELGVGALSGARGIGSSTVVGIAGHVELGVPQLGASWYRPSVRLGVAYWETLVKGAFGGNDHRLVAGRADVCPFGAALASTRTLDVIASACGELNVGSAVKNDMASRLWTDAGGVGRLSFEVGRKGHYRGVIIVEGGLLRRLGDPVSASLPASDPTSSTGGFSVPPEPTTMWTARWGGGLLFP